MGLSDRRIGWKKWIIAVWAFMECLLFSGMLYGWGSLSFVLKSEGIYADLCEDGNVNGSSLAGTNDVASLSASSTMASSLSPNLPNTDDNLLDESLKSCNPQDSNMALCFTIASSLFGIGSAVLGYVNYRLGTRVTRLIAICLLLSGSIMMVLVSKNTPWLMFPGNAFLSMGGLPILITNTQVSYLFTNGGSIVVGLLNGAFDTSSGVMLLMKIAHEHGFIRQNMFILIAALQSTMLISTFLFLPKGFVDKLVTRSNDVIEVKDKDTDSDIKDVTPTNANKGLKTYLLNSKFLTMLIWFSILHLRFQYFIGTLNQYLTRLLDTKNEVSYFTNVCYLIMLCGLVGSFVSGAVYDWQYRKCKDGKSLLYRELMPSVLPLSLTSMFALLMSVMVLIPVTEVLYPIFIVMTIYRSFLYSSTAAFISSTFPSQHFGILRGVVELTGAVIATLQYAFFTWTEAYVEGPLHTDVFLLCLTSLSFTHPLYWGIKCWRNEEKIRKPKFYSGIHKHEVKN